MAVREDTGSERRAVYVRTLRRALEMLGSKDRLRERLRVAMSELDAWLAGREAPPLHAFLGAVDLINAAWTDQRSSPAGAIRRAWQLVHYNELLKATSQRIIEESRTVMRLVSTPARTLAIVETALDEALAITGAERGNVQLLCAQGLRLVAHRGFAQPFLEFFAVVPHGAFACGAALRQRSYVAIDDVERHEAFADRHVLAVMLEANARACQSVPIADSSGGIVGMLSTHYSRPHRPAPRERAKLEALAGRVASALLSLA